MAELNAAGNITGTDGTVELATGDNAAVSVALEGTWNATVNFEVTYDGVRWDAAQVFTLANVAAASTATTNVDRLIDARGAERVRARANPFTSGTIAVALSAGEGVVAAVGGGGGAVTVADGADVALGSTTDIAVGDASGTLIGHARSIAKSLLGTLTVGGSITAASTMADGANVTFGALADAAAGSDAGAATFMGLMKRHLQRFTTLLGQLPAALTGSGNLKTAIVESTATVTTVAPSVISTANSTTATLAGNAVFTGAGEDVSNYSTISVAVFTDQASATSGLSIQFSSDNTNWDYTETYTQAITAAGAGLSYYSRPRARFFRIVYTNGGVGQTAFRLQTVLHIADQNNAPSGLQADLRFSPSVPGMVPLVYDASVPRFGMQAAAKVLPDSDTGSRTAAVHTQMYGGGVNFDRMRNCQDVTLLASAARTTTQTSADITTYNCIGIIVTLDMTVVGTGSVTLTINYKDPASGKYILLLSGVAVITNITSTYFVHPSVVAVTNVAANRPAARTLQIVVTANNANSATYSVGYTLVV